MKRLRGLTNKNMEAALPDERRRLSGKAPLGLNGETPEYGKDPEIAATGELNRRNTQSARSALPPVEAVPDSYEAKPSYGGFDDEVTELVRESKQVETPPYSVESVASHGMLGTMPEVDEMNEPNAMLGMPEMGGMLPEVSETNDMLGMPETNERGEAETNRLREIERSSTDDSDARRQQMLDAQIAAEAQLNAAFAQAMNRR